MLALREAALGQFSEDRTRVRVVLASGPAPGPAVLRLALVHPTLSGEDQAIALDRTAPGIYKGRLRAPRLGRMRLRLEDGAGHWRLAGDWATKDDGVRLAPR